MAGLGFPLDDFVRDLLGGINGADGMLYACMIYPTINMNRSSVCDFLNRHDLQVNAPTEQLVCQVSGKGLLM